MTITVRERNICKITWKEKIPPNTVCVLSSSTAFTFKKENVDGSGGIVKYKLIVAVHVQYSSSLV